ncbi:MAG TPA: DUF3750 domain-containing protein [Burkholderiales bacterium]|nr:DUF3750 domain-containing protein [Burkholderiales bacterium]
MSRVNRLWSKLRMVGLLLAAAGAALGLAPRDWRSASASPAGLAPDPAATPEAVVQVYGARVSGWRGIFGVHTWIAVKPSNAPAFTVYEVVGWRLRWADSVVAIGGRRPDGPWYGARAELLADLRGEQVDRLIARIDRLAQTYPYAGRYTVWPGPNSNTFVAWITRAVPELQVEFPPTAIGKDYLPRAVWGTAPSGRGFQLSLFGLLALTASPVEGFEVNLCTMTFGFNPFTSTLKLPVFGRVAVPMPSFSWRAPRRSLSRPAVQVATVASEASIHPWPTSEQAEAQIRGSLRRAA